MRTRTAFPQDWATTQNNLANAYNNRISGDRAENLEVAIHHYGQALQVYTRDAFPQYWATTQNNLANAYRNRISGDRAENLEAAIHHYQQALQVRTRDAFPQDWAMTQNNLAAAYSDRISGDRAENLEVAIHRFQQALTVRTVETLPADCLQTSRNLGNLHFQAENWADAATAYETALAASERLRTWAAHEDRRQAVHNEVAQVYTNLVRCYVNLNRYGKALETVERSRSKRLVELMAGSNLNSDGNIPPEIQTLLAQIDDCQTQIDTLRGLNSGVGMADPPKSPLTRGTFSDPSRRHQHSSRRHQHSSRRHQHSSRRHSSPPDQNYSPLMKGGWGGSLHHTNKQQSNRAALKAATEAIRTLETEKQQLRQKLSQLDPVSAGLLQVSPPNLAALASLLTEPTTALLSFYTTRDTTYIFILRQTETGEVVTTCHTCPENLEDHLQNWLIDNWLLPYAKINTADTEAERSQNYHTWADAIPDILAQLAQRLDFSTLIEQHLQGIAELILVPHLLLHQIPFAALPVCADRRGDTGTRGRGEEGCILGKELSRPESALTEDSIYLGDLFQLRQVPNTQVLEFCQNRPEPNPANHHGTVEDATDDLPCANFEGERIAQLLKIPPENRLRGGNATVTRYRHLIAQTHSLLSSHHAQSRLDSPLESALVLADGTITMGQLLTPAWRLPHLSDIFLSCCETGLGFSADFIDDPLNLAAGFLCAGARNVVSTLWSVDDLATSLFTIRYYHHRQTRNRPAALQAAQRDLRTLTGKDLKRHYFKELNAILEDRYDEATAHRDKAKNTDPKAYERWAAVATKIDTAQSRLKQLCKQAFPFANPVYWAGFVSQGVR